MEIEEKKNMEENIDISQYPADVQEALRQGLTLRQIYRNLLTQYSRVMTPQKNLLAEYVVRAKGPERSLRQFAEELGVNVSTLSRIVNKKTASANSDTLIADIAALADKNSGVTFEMLMDAHGLANSVRNGTFRFSRVTEEAVRTVVLDELLKRGYSITLNEDVCMDTLGGRFRFDFSITTNAINRDDGRWGFDVCLLSQRSGTVTDRRFLAMNIMRRLSRLGSLYANWDYPFERVSMVVTDREAFYEVTERLRNCYLKNEISLILVDLERAVVEDEFLIPWIEECKCEPVFTELEEREDNCDQDDAWNEIYGDEF